MPVVSGGSTSSGASSASPKPPNKPKFKFFRFLRKDAGEKRRNSVDQGEVVVRKGDKKRRPYSMSFSDHFGRKTKAAAASSSQTNGCSSSSCRQSCRKKTGKKKGPCPCQLDSAAAALGRFEDEDDLYSEVDKAKKSEEELEYEDAGVCLASVSSSSPASSQKGQQPLGNSTPEALRRKPRPTSCTFGAAPDLHNFSSSTKINEALSDCNSVRGKKISLYFHSLFRIDFRTCFPSLRDRLTPLTAQCWGSPKTKANKP